METTMTAEVVPITKAPKGKAARASKSKRGKRTRTATPFAKGTGYKGHREGSRKEQAHRWFDELGAEAALPKVLKTGIKASTAKSWFAFWRKEGTTRAPAKTA
jgi:hypothetical protein